MYHKKEVSSGGSGGPRGNYWDVLKHNLTTHLVSGWEYGSILYLYGPGLSTKKVDGLGGEKKGKSKKKKGRLTVGYMMPLTNLGLMRFAIFILVAGNW